MTLLFFLLCQKRPSSGVGRLAVGLLLVFVNKVSLACSHTHSVYCLWLPSRYNELNSCNKDHIDHKSKIFTIWPFKKNLFCPQNRFATDVSLLVFESKWKGSWPLFGVKPSREVQRSSENRARGSSWSERSGCYQSWICRTCKHCPGSLRNPQRGD